MLNEIIKKIKPSKEERKKIEKEINFIIKKIKNKEIVPIIGGSIAKDTWLKGIHDIDIFAKFNYNKYKDKSDKLSYILEKRIKNLKLVRLHGSRDYFQVKKGKYTFEIVPILDIKKSNEAINITDVSPLHSEWVNKKGKKLKDEIRLVKAFAKANLFYGAETHVQGFSGYVLEILTVYYKSFNNLVKNVTKWKNKTVIDIEKQLKNPLNELNYSKTLSPLVLVDPVDRNRNAAAVVSREKYNLFIKTCKEFLKNHSEKFFVKKEIKIPKNSIAVSLGRLKGKKDVIGRKLFSLLKKLEKKLKLEEYKVIRSEFIFEDKIVFWFKLQENKLSDYMEVKGPPLKFNKNVIEFKKKHKNTYLKNNVVYAKEKRKFNNAKDFVKNWLKEKKLKFEKIGVK